MTLSVRKPVINKPMNCVNLHTLMYLSLQVSRWILQIFPSDLSTKALAFVERHVKALFTMLRLYLPC